MPGDGRESAVSAGLHGAAGCAGDGGPGGGGQGADIVLCVTPSEHMRGVFGQIAPLLTRDQIAGERDQGTGREEPAAHVAGDCVGDG